MKPVRFNNNMSRSFHRFGLQIKKHSPEILVVAGVAGTVVSAVMACKATLKVNDILAETKENVTKIHDLVADESVTEEQYSKQDSISDLTKVYAKAGVELVKLYGPALAIGALSIGSILTSHNVMRKRNVALAAAYSAVDKGFKEYRNRVVDRFGRDLDRELRYNLKAKEIEETVVDEAGNEKTVKTTVIEGDPTVHSDYARFFDDGCKGWCKDSSVNLMTVKTNERYANELLQSRGYLFLNDVYDMFGIPRTKAGQIVGWVYDLKNPVGDNFVDFGIYDIHDERKRAFVNGYESVILLDFNVDGNILDLI